MSRIRWCFICRYDCPVCIRDADRYKQTWRIPVAAIVSNCGRSWTTLSHQNGRANCRTRLSRSNNEKIGFWRAVSDLKQWTSVATVTHDASIWNQRLPNHNLLPVLSKIVRHLPANRPLAMMPAQKAHVNARRTLPPTSSHLLAPTLSPTWWYEFLHRECVVCGGITLSFWLIA